MDTQSVAPTAGDDNMPRVPAIGYRGETYYGKPALKSSPFKWQVPAYLFLGGLAGGAQLLAAIADLFAPQRARSIVRNGRYVAMAGAVAGPLLLIFDLKTPQRWYNMLRIFRKTSPMSIGSYILTIFGLSSTLAAGAEFLRRDRRGAANTIARTAQVPAALAGAGMCAYSGALLAATSTPLWSATPRLLAARFASSAVATAAAALSLLESLNRRGQNARALDKIALAAVATECAVGIAERTYRDPGVAAVLHESPWGAANRAAEIIGIGVPLACHAFDFLAARRSRALSMTAALAILAGAAMMRTAWIYTGNESARRPLDYFRLTQPQEDAALPHSAESRCD